jgi:hypothetical protein
MEIGDFDEATAHINTIWMYRHRLNEKKVLESKVNIIAIVN